MLIALVSDAYLPRLGGIEVQVAALARWLRRAGHEVDVFTITPQDASTGPAVHRYAEAEAAPVHRLGRRLPRGILVDPAARTRLRTALQARPYDVVHAHRGTVSPFASDAIDLALDLRLPSVATWHSIGLPGLPGLPGGHPRLRRWAASGTLISAVSDVAAQPLRDSLARVRTRAGEPATVQVLPNAIDPQFWTPGPARPPRGEGDPIRVVTAARMSGRKRGLHLVRALPKVRDMVPAARAIEVTILGDGSQRDSMTSAARRGGVGDWVHFPGRVGAAQLRETLYGSDLFVSPVVHEAFGIAALEARAVGLPVVGMAGSGLTEFITDEVDGLLADGDDALAAALARLITDDALRLAITEHNRSTRPAQVWPDAVAAVESAYRQAIDVAGPGRGR